MLGAIGLDEMHESQRTARSCRVGAADVPDLAHRLALAEYDTERALRRLERHGLAAQSSARPGRWVAAPPGRRARRAADPAAARAGEGGAGGGAARRGVPGAGRRAGRARSGRGGHGRRGRRAAVPPAPAGRDGRGLRAGHRQADRRVTGWTTRRRSRPPRAGCRYRVVVEREVLSTADGTHGAVGRARPGRAGTGRRPGADEAGDRRRGARDGAAYLAHARSPRRSSSTRAGSWSRCRACSRRCGGTPCRCGSARAAAPSPSRSRDGPDGTDLEILSLLLAGLTDASVAKQLDLGLRTVQRRVKRLMELTGVTTRLQLGWHAYERGWVARDAPAQPRGEHAADG